MFTYRDARITCAALPSSGGLMWRESLQILERFPLGCVAPVERDHLVVEALRRGLPGSRALPGRSRFRRAARMADTRAYADRRAASIDPARPPRARSSTRVTVLREGDNTTHFSIVDADGNRVAATLSASICRSAPGWSPAIPACCSTTR